MCCGQKGGDPPPDYSYAIYQQEQARLAKEKEERTAKAAQARTSATTGARSDAEAEAIRRGLNPEDYSGLIDREISKSIGLVPDDDLNPGQYFQNFGKNTFDTEESGLRNKYVGEVNRLAPVGFDRVRTPDNLLDPTIEEIIAGQYNTAKGGLDAARARGTLTDTGYGSALGGLDTKRGGARAQFDPIISSVLSGVRGAQTGLADTYRQQASSLNLGQSFDSTAFGNALNETESREEAAAPGRVKSLAPTTLFDIGELLNQGGMAQGAQNAPIIATPKEQQKKQTKRGLGSTGAF